MTNKLKLFKKLSALTLLFTLSLNSFTLNAQTLNGSNVINKDYISISVDELPSMKIDNGTVIVFENQADYQSYMNAKKARTPDVTIKTTPISSQNVSYKWAGYHPQTPSWIKASSYAITNSRNYTIGTSISYDSTTINFSVNLLKGVTVNCPADANRFSRLGVWTDLTVGKSRVDEYYFGTNTIYRTYYIYPVNIRNTYIDPKYQ